MMRRVNAQRGQALLETSLVLPVFLLILFGLIWMVQTNVIAERDQISVRFNGLVTSEDTPYSNYSLYALYNGLPGGTLAGGAVPCQFPNDDPVLDQGSYVPGPQIVPFFALTQPSSAGGSGCSITHLSGGALLTPLLFMETNSQITSYINVSPLLRSALPGIQNITAQENDLETPDEPRLIYCYPELSSAVVDSVNHTAMGAAAPPAPISTSPSAVPLNLNLGC